MGDYKLKTVKVEKQFANTNKIKDNYSFKLTEYNYKNGVTNKFIKGTTGSGSSSSNFFQGWAKPIPEEERLYKYQDTPLPFAIPKTAPVPVVLDLSSTNNYTYPFDVVKTITGGSKLYVRYNKDLDCCQYSSSTEVGATWTKITPASRGIWVFLQGGGGGGGGASSYRVWKDSRYIGGGGGGGGAFVVAYLDLSYGDNIVTLYAGTKGAAGTNGWYGDTEGHKSTKGEAGGDSYMVLYGIGSQTHLIDAEGGEGGETAADWSVTTNWGGAGGSVKVNGNIWMGRLNKYVNEWITIVPYNTDYFITNTRVGGGGGYVDRGNGSRKGGSVEQYDSLNFECLDLTVNARRDWKTSAGSSYTYYASGLGATTRGYNSSWGDKYSEGGGGGASYCSGTQTTKIGGSANYYTYIGYGAGGAGGSCKMVPQGAAWDSGGGGDSDFLSPQAGRPGIVGIIKHTINDSN